MGDKRTHFPATCDFTMTKYYLSRDTSRPVFVESRKYLFDPCLFSQASNTWWGTFVAETPAHLADMAAAEAAGLCTEIDSGDWKIYQAKKKHSRPVSNLIDLGQSHAPQQLSAPSGRPVEVVESRPPAKAAVKMEAETLEEVISPRKGRR